MGLFRRRASRIWIWVIVVAGGFLPVARGAGPSAAGADSAADLESQYEDVLAALKNPPAHGVLVAEIEPDSPAGAAGLRGGDIITEYFGERIGNLKDLRAQVAEATARVLVDPHSGVHVLVKAFRNGKTMIFELPRAPLGIRAIDVEAGVPGPRNPPANLRGTIAFNWQRVLASATEDAPEGAAAFRTTLQVPGAASGGGLDDPWLGWETMQLEPDGASALKATIAIHHVDPESGASIAKGGSALPATTLSLHMLLGDFKTSAPFILDTLTEEYTGADGAEISAAARRFGLTLRANIRAAGGNPPRNSITTREGRFPQDAILEPAVPIVAAAMPHEAHAVLAVQLLSVRDLMPRPGYVIETLGKRPLPAYSGGAAASATQRGAAARPVETAWRADVLFCGVLVESCWFTEERRLLAIRTEAAQPVISRRVADAAIAATGDLQAQTQRRAASPVPAQTHP